MVRCSMETIVLTLVLYHSVFPRISNFSSLRKSAPQIQIACSYLFLLQKKAEQGMATGS